MCEQQELCGRLRCVSASNNQTNQKHFSLAKFHACQCLFPKNKSKKQKNQKIQGTEKISRVAGLLVAALDSLISCQQLASVVLAAVCLLRVLHPPSPPLKSCSFRASTRVSICGKSCANAGAWGGKHRYICINMCVYI